MGKGVLDALSSVLDRVQTRRAHIGALVAVLAAGSGSLLYIGMFEVGQDSAEPALAHNLWFDLGIVCGILMLCVGLVLVAAIILPTLEERLDSRLRRAAIDLAEQIKAWLDAELVDDPLPGIEAAGKKPTMSDRELHNQLWGQVGLAFGSVFGAPLRDFNTELHREQIPRRFGSGFSVLQIRGLVKELRAFGETRGPLVRG